MSTERIIPDAATVHATQAYDAHEALAAHQPHKLLRQAKQYRQTTIRHAGKALPAHDPANAGRLPKGLQGRRVTAVHGDGRGGGRQPGGKQDRKQDGKQQGGKQPDGQRQRGQQQSRQQQDGRERRGPLPGGQGNGTAGGYGSAGTLPRVRSTAVGATGAAGAAGASAAVAPRSGLQSLANELHDRPMLLDQSLRAEWIRQCFMANEEGRTHPDQRGAHLRYAIALDMLKARRRTGDFSRSAADDLSGIRQDLIASSAALRASPIAPPRDEKEETHNALLPLWAFHGTRPLCPSMLDRAIRHVSTTLNTLVMGGRKPCGDDASEPP
ncbi:MAG: hypothetical protein RXR52_36470 [Paraburkholderia sp.]|uniref:hypothetical protein n=2 Tax=Paraburkholderia sp. TaxID=1926495 RepID=UPI00397CE78C